jgi:hypothetical protein
LALAMELVVESGWVELAVVLEVVSEAWAWA